MRSLLFVCTANICRSPMAEGVFRKLIAEKGLARDLEVDSAGTHDYHVGKPPFPLAVETARKRGYELGHITSRRIRADDFDHFDVILAMDRMNIRSLRTIAPTRSKHKIELLLDYGDLYHAQDVPDPYGGQPKDFEIALDMIEDGCMGLTELLVRIA